MLIELAQSADAGSFPKLVQHPHIGHGLAIGQVGKATPRALFGQQAHQLVERVDRGQDAQEMDAVQLGGTELWRPPPPARTRKQIVDEGVRNIWGEERQILGGTCGGQQGIHEPFAYPKRTEASTVFAHPSFFRCNSFNRSRLYRIP